MNKPFLSIETKVLGECIIRNASRFLEAREDASNIKYIRSTKVFGCISDPITHVRALRI